MKKLAFSKNKIGIIFAITAALLYALSTPISKILLNYISPTFMAGFLYLGAGFGMLFLIGIKKATNKNIKQNFRLCDLPYIIGMILLDTAAPILLMIGLSSSNAESVSLLNNFEIVATAVIALLFFKEKISFRLFLGIILVTSSCVLLSFDNLTNLQFSYGSIFVLLACLCWGLENNCTRKLSNHSPTVLVSIKGIFAGLISLIIAFILNEKITNIWSIIVALILGFVAFGLSIFFYIYAQRYLGASKTSTFYAFAPFISVALSFIIFTTHVHYIFWVALVLMILGAFLASNDKFYLFRKKANNANFEKYYGQKNVLKNTKMISKNKN